MSFNRKLLLCFTIILILTCYGYTFYLIKNDSNLKGKIVNKEISYSDSIVSALTKKIKETDEKIRTHDGEWEKDIEPILITKSKFKDNQLNNGASPFNSCFGNGDFYGNAELTIKNGASTDAIVCLYSLILNKTIRNEYVRKNSSFKIKNISEGTYKIRVFFGNDWNPEIKNPCGLKGYFDSDVSFSEFDGSEYFEDSDQGYTIAKITLYAVSGGNATTSQINSADFFSN